MEEQGNLLTTNSCSPNFAASHAGKSLDLHVHWIHLGPAAAWEASVIPGDGGPDSRVAPNVQGWPGSSSWLVYVGKEEVKTLEHGVGVCCHDGCLVHMSCTVSDSYDDAVTDGGGGGDDDCC